MLNTRFELDVKGDDGKSINTWLISRNLPTPSSIPPRLMKMKKMGCKEILLPGGRKAAVICFVQNAGGMIHLIMIKNDIIKDHHLPILAQVTQKNCYYCKETRWNVARWQDSEHTFILLAKKNAENERDILQYF